MEIVATGSLNIEPRINRQGDDLNLDFRNRFIERLSSWNKGIGSCVQKPESAEIGLSTAAKNLLLLWHSWKEIEKPLK